MQNYPGVFIVLEGVDGSGKGTQFKLLAERLMAVGYDVEVFDFPRYEEASSYFVKRYLNGDYGPAKDISPYSASLFYALDRFEAAPAIRKALTDGKIVLSNRYVGSNMAHQGAKFSNEAEQRGFFMWADSMEYQLLGIPRPNLNLFLRVPADIAIQLVAKKAQRSYTDKKHDEHEADIEHLRNAVKTYDVLCQLFPRDFKTIECTSDDKILSVPEISNLIWRTIKEIIPGKPTKPASQRIINMDSVSETTAKPAPSSKSAQSEPKKSELSLLASLELAKTSSIKHIAHSDNNKPHFYIPVELNGELKIEFQKYLNELVDMRDLVYKALNGKKVSRAQQLADKLLPLATLTQTQISKPDYGGNLKELRRLSTNTSERPKSQAKLQRLVNNELTAGLSTSLEPLTMTDYWPRNEFDLLSEGLYGLSDLPREELLASINSWTYDKKYKTLEELIPNIDSGVASQIRYRWDIIADIAVLLDLFDEAGSTSVQLQALTPRYGYDVPRVIEDTGLDDIYIRCFDMSLEMFSKLQTLSNPLVASYAVLLGHRSRFQLSATLNGIRSLNQTSTDMKKLSKALITSISEHHPVIGASLKNVFPSHTRSSKKRK